VRPPRLRGTGGPSSGSVFIYKFCFLPFFVIFKSGTDLIQLLILFWLLFSTSCWGWFLQRKPKDPSFQIASGWNLAGYSSSRLCIGYSIRLHTIKMAAMTLFHAEKCCRLVTAHEVSARRICSSVRQFLIRSTFVLVLEIIAVVVCTRETPRVCYVR